MTRPAFESSLAALRDNVVMAIERREAGVVQDGLDVYRRVITAIMDEQRRLEEATGPEPSSTLPLGREWDQVLRDLHGVMDSVSASASRLLWIDVLSWVREIAVVCADRGVVNGLGNILALFDSAWSQELAAPSLDAASRQDALLLHLSEFGAFYLRRGQPEDPTLGGADVIYARTFLRIIKRAIESGDTEATKVSIKYFLYGTASRHAGLSAVTGAGLLALYAWILYRFDHNEQDESFKVICAQIANTFDSDEAFVPTLRASDELERELGWQWWELRERGPISTGVVEIGTYMSLALILIAGPRLVWERLDPASSDDLNAARRLMTVVDSFEQGGFSGVRAQLGLSDGHFQGLKARLAQVIDQGDALLEEGYARLPVDQDRVAAFRSAVRERLAEERTDSLLSALAELPSAAGSASPNFGLDTLIPRWYFAETRVHAEPASLAEDLVRGLVRGEQERILNRVVSDLTNSSETTLSSLREQLDAASAERDLADPVVVTNSYQAHALLTGRHLDRIDDGVRSPFRGVVFRVHDDRQSFVALLSPGTPSVRLRPVTPSVAGDEAIEGFAVILGISELAPEEMDALVGRESRSRIDEARLRGSIRVRLLEHLEVVMGEEDAPQIWTLPEDTW